MKRRRQTPRAVCVFVHKHQQNGKTVIRAVEPMSGCVVVRPYDDDSDLEDQFEDAALIAYEESGVRRSGKLLCNLIPKWPGFDIGFDQMYIAMEH